MIKPKSIWWNYADVINWVFTRNLRLLNLTVVDQQQHPRTKRYALEELRLPDGSPLLSKEGEVEVCTRLLGERDQSELSGFDIIAMIGRPGGEYDGHAEAVRAINQALQTGKLECWARPVGGGKRELVSAVEWADLIITERPDPVAVLQSGAPVWQELRFKSESVIELWPPEQAGEEAPDSGDTQEDPPAQLEDGGTAVGQNQIGKPSLNRKPRKRDAGTNADIKSKILSVLSAADSQWPKPEKRPQTAYTAARLLVAGKFGKLLRGYSEVTVKKILAGTYEPMKRFDISGRY